MSANYSYYDKQSAMVKIAHALKNRGWKVYGYRADESDSMTDYWSPASCDGIFEKNGYILCTNISEYNVKSYSGKEVYKYTYNTVKPVDNKRIEALKNITVERGATEAEAENAKARIEQILNNNQQEQDKKDKSKVIDYVYPVFQANPNRCTWHIELDNALIAKGTNIYKFSDLPYCYDEATGKINEGYAEARNGLSEEKQQIIKDFEAFILRLERIANSQNTMGDGTTETEQQAIEQQENEKLEKVIEKVTKKVLKMVEVKRNYFKEGDYITLSHHGHYWKITSEYMQKGTWKGVTDTKKAFVYEIVGSESRGYKELKNPKSYYAFEFRMLESLEEGKIKIFELKEVEEIQEVEKWVRVKNESKKAETKKEKSTVTADKKQSTEKEIITIEDVTITEDVDTRDNTPLWVAKLNNRVSKEEYIKINSYMKTIKGYYSKFKGGFIFKFDPTIILGGEPETIEVEEIPQEETQPINNIIIDEIEEKSECLISESTTIMERLNLNHTNYFTNEEYKKELLNYIRKVNIDKQMLKVIIEYITKVYNFIGLIEVLKDFYSLEFKSEYNKNTKTNKAENKQGNTKLLNKIETQLNSNQKKIDHLSGDYLTNTWKRMREQESRDKQKLTLQFDSSILEYLKNKIENNSITELEINLSVKTFRDGLNAYYNKKYVWKNQNIIEYPKIDYSMPLDNWYNQEVPTRQKRLQKANINNTEQLHKAIDEYKNIIDILRGNSEVDLLQQKIKKLEREYKMQQKGDINFTPKELVDYLLELADIKQGEKILEPSAGIGNIADNLKKITNNIDVCEYMYSYAELLKLKGYNVLCNDFMELNSFNNYDKIVMNPPFSKEQEHIQHAYKMLKGNGRIVAITSSHWTFANDKKSQEFREWLDTTNYYEVFESDIKFEFTNVNYKILVIEKSANENIEVA